MTRQALEALSAYLADVVGVALRLIQYNGYYDAYNLYRRL